MWQEDEEKRISLASLLVKLELSTPLLLQTKKLPQNTELSRDRVSLRLLKFKNRIQLIENIFHRMRNPMN
ncbi:unnamed protein product [Cuscuta campestris]|uniref:Uncharacterized protein n=1 Tax=Cuscuta campestris TaxID=132261 RepID=A0A484KUM0_9ASTE|nr:unnamed protein product [Cuscuta campestris]